MALTTTSIAAWTTSCGSPRVYVIPADKAVHRMTNGVPYAPSVNGWFVPDARMLQILDALPPADK